jgi:hypothetical protein
MRSGLKLAIIWNSVNFGDPFSLVLDNTYLQAISYLIPHQSENKPGERPGRREQGENKYPHSRLSRWTKCCRTESGNRS